MRFSLLVLCFIAFSCKKEKPLIATSLDNVVIIPQPSEVLEKPFGFLFNEETSIQFDTISGTSGLSEQFENLVQVLPFPVKRAYASEPSDNTINFQLVSKDSIPDDEGYVLDINNDRISLVGSAHAGLFRGFQTLKQVMSEQVITGVKIDTLVIPGIKIIDQPQFKYRGMMLDVARHFFTVNEVKRLIDQMTAYKLNKLHLHLTDDQGWRIEIKSWPKLTEIGGSSSVKNERPGFYTQNEYKDIVQYAADRFITVIPEIDMPGHTNAALASYPELNCDDKSTQLYTGMRVGFSSLCVDKEVTYQFVDDVIREIAAITPGKYIHLGGDESHSTSKKDYNLFLNKVFKIVQSYNKQVMGWEDIQSAGVNNSFIIQHWTNVDRAQKALDQGARVVLSPAKYMYLDMKYTEQSPLGLDWAGLVEVDTAYGWKYETLFKEENEKQIVGFESPLWSETISSSEDIEYLAFPRLIGHAEMGWSSPEALNWKDYKQRLLIHLKRLELQGINYYRSPNLFE